MDADLQDDPNEIEHLISKLDEGWDLVSGWKEKRYDPLKKTIPSKFFNYIVRKISKLHSENSTLISEKEELSIDIQRLLDQIEKLASIIADNLHHIQDIESQREALTEWFPNYILRKFILEKVPVTAPKLEELSPKIINPLLIIMEVILLLYKPILYINNLISTEYLYI